MGDDPVYPTLQFTVSRNVYNVNEFNASHPQIQPKSKLPFAQRLRSCIHSISVSKTVSSIFPFYSILVSFYTFKCIAFDLLAGATMSILHVPQGMAYGTLAGIRPVNGLYTSFFPALVYFFFGTSRHISIGTFSIVALLSAEPVDRLSRSFKPMNLTAESGPSATEQLDFFRLQVAITVTILSGLVQLAMGMFRLGVLVVYISAPLLGGFTCASAFHVLASQLGSLFGVKLSRITGPGRLILVSIEFCKRLPETNVATIITSIICVTILILFRFVINPRVVEKTKFPVPAELLVLVIATIVSHFAKLYDRFNVAIVGEIPSGLPSPMLPNLSIVPEIIMESLIVSFVTVATTISLVKLYATKFGYKVRYTQELSALGLSNFVGGFFQCHAASGALARTSVVVNVGMQSQVASLISCAIILLVLMVIGPLLQSVPKAVLSSIIAVSLYGIFHQITDLPKLYRSSLFDLAIWVVAFLATVFIDVPYGLLVGLAFSLCTILYRTQHSYGYELGRIPETDIYVNLNQYIEAERIPGLCIIRYGGPLYFANTQTFKDLIINISEVDPNQMVENRTTHRWSDVCTKCVKWRSSKSSKEAHTEGIEFEEIVQPFKQKLKFIIVDLSSWSFLDSSGSRIIDSLISNYEKVGIQLLFTWYQSQIKLTTFGAGPKIAVQDDHSFVSLHDAVTYATNEVLRQNSDGFIAPTSENAIASSSL